MTFRPPDRSGLGDLRQCAGKRRFRHEAKAIASAAELTAKRGRPLRVYYCGLCTGFHLTSRPAPVVDAKKPEPTKAYDWDLFDRNRAKAWGRPEGGS